jgi:predicted membrane-bound spermidine synthase
MIEKLKKHPLNVKLSYAFLILLDFGLVITFPIAGGMINCAIGILVAVITLADYHTR